MIGWEPGPCGSCGRDRCACSPEDRAPEAPLTDSELFAKGLHDLALLAMKRAARRRHAAWLARTVVCPVCGGRGHGADVWDECGMCDGTGRVSERERVEHAEAAQ